MNRKHATIIGVAVGAAMATLIQNVTVFDRTVDPQPIAAPIESVEVQALPVYTEDDVKCLAENIYGEARNQDFTGQLAVAFVTINRSKDPRFSHSICGVVHANKAFSWTLPWREQIANLRGKHHREKDTPGARLLNERAKQSALAVARVALDNPTLSPVGDATFYHDKHIHPSWVKEKVLVTVIGRHEFYSWPSKNS
jgi:spore germination cell wall hydrolase CwlJ-like protein